MSEVEIANDGSEPEARAVLAETMDGNFRIMEVGVDPLNIQAGKQAGFFFMGKRTHQTFFAIALLVKIARTLEGIRRELSGGKN